GCKRDTLSTFRFLARSITRLTGGEAGKSGGRRLTGLCLSPLRLTGRYVWIAGPCPSFISYTVILGKNSGSGKSEKERILPEQPNPCLRFFVKVSNMPDPTRLLHTLRDAVK